MHSKVSHNKSGGLEGYVFNLLDILKDHGHQVEIFYISEISRNNKFERKYFYNYECDAFYKYDIIINNTDTIVDKRFNNNVIWVQHSSLKLYFKFSKIYLRIVMLSIFKFQFKNTLYWLLFIIFFYKSPVNFYKNIALYNFQHLNNKCKNSNIFYTYIPIKIGKINNIENIYKTKKYDVCFFGRIDNFSKNMKLLNKLSTKFNLRIDVFGDGPDLEMLNSRFINKKGYLSSNEIYNLGIYKVALFPSLFEGACMAMHEIIQIGILPLVSNFSSEINFIRNNSSLSFLVIENKNDLLEWKNKIDIITNLSEKEYSLLSQELIFECSKIYRENIFSDSWLGVINNIKLHK